ncbi:ABC transporter transmembrane domain-containing protein [Streptomyces sp. CA-253872]|uniref:ABC transporter transmembrane domain-containing protein n=1 Tax=Streptomyces sp. CA-253872 TaxID=3240067 RepID=UPI003D8C0C81
MPVKSPAPDAPPGVPPARGPGAVLAAAVRSVRGPLLGSLVLLAGHQAGEALVPVVVGIVVDRAVDGGATGALLGCLALLAADFLFLSLCYRFGSRLSTTAREHSAHHLRVRLAGRLLAHDDAAGSDRLPGDLLTVTGSDTQVVGQFTSRLGTTTGNLTAVGLGAALLLRMSVPLGLLVLVGTPAVLLLMNRAGRPLERRGATEQAAAARAAATAVDYVSGLRVLKGLRAERTALRHYEGVNRASLRATVAAARTEAVLDGAGTLLAGVLVAAVALVAGRLALSGDLGLGDLIACVGLCQFLLAPIQGLLELGPALARARASARRVAALVDAPPPPPGTAKLPEGAPVRGELTVRGLAHDVLRGVDLSLAPGEHVGLVVPDPVAAAELLACLTGDLAPAHGAIRLDGVRLGALDRAEARTAVLVAPHQAHLFDGTVLDNLRSGDDEREDGPGDAAALRAAAADDLVDALPEGTATRVGERGAFLSGGQRQRLALARALRAAPPVLVLHDPTTAVDAVTQTRIARGIRTLRAGRTTLILTSSPALLAACDRVAVLHEGRVTASAPHSALLATDAFYGDVVHA